MSLSFGSPCYRFWCPFNVLAGHQPIINTKLCRPTSLQEFSTGNSDLPLVFEKYATQCTPPQFLTHQRNAA